MAAFAACGDGPSLPTEVFDGEALAGATISVVHGESQQGEVATYLSDPVIVEVRSEDGALLSGAPVEWTFRSGQGVSADEMGKGDTNQSMISYTDGSGRASAVWLLGTVAGEQTGSARIAGNGAPTASQVTGSAAASPAASGLTFHATATPGAPRHVEMSPEVVTIRPGRSVNIAATTVDEYGNVISITAYQWSSSEPSVATVDGEGRVTAQGEGSTVITASAGSYTGKAAVMVGESAATGGSHTLQKYAGDDQSGRVGQALDRQLEILVTDAAGEPVQDAEVAWTVRSGGGRLTSAMSHTGALGRARATWVLGNTVGRQRVEVEVAGLPTLTFEATATAATVARLQILPRESSMPVGETVQLQVVARDENGNEIKGVDVSWSSSDPNVAVVSANGLLSGRGRGTANIRAGVDGVIATHSTTVGGGVRYIQNAGGSGQTGQAGEILPNKPTVRIVDGQGERVPGVTISFEVKSGGGSVSTARAVTDDRGEVQVEWTLGGMLGQQQLEARTEGLPALTFVADAEAGPLATLEVSPARSTLGVGETRRLSVTGADRFGNPRSDISVRWRTGDAGFATVSNDIVTGVSAGTATITGTAEGVSDTHQVTVEQAARGLERVRGNGQTGNVGERLGGGIAARVVDGSGNGVEGVDVNWSVRSGGGSLSASSVTTNSSGVAEVRWTLGDAEGRQEIVAETDGVSSLVFHATAVTPDAGAEGLQRAGGNGQTGRVATTLPGRPTVRVVDGSGNGVSGVTVTWQVRSGGGRLNTGNTTTNDSGEAQVSWTLGETAGRQEIVASSEDLPSLVFNATAQPGPVARVNVSPNSSTLQEGGSIQLSAEAWDEYGNRISNPTMSWSSSAAGVATVTSGGRVNAVAAGSATIRGTSNGQSDTHSVTVEQAVSPGTGRFHEPDGFTPVLNEDWDNFTDNGWYHEIKDAGNVETRNGRLIWTYPAGMEGGFTPGGKVVKDHFPHGPYEYHRDEGVTLSSNFHGHRSGVNKLRYWSDQHPRSPIMFVGTDNNRLTLGMNLSGWPEGTAAIRWDSDENYATPTLEQATVTRGVGHTIETLIYVGHAGRSDGWIKAWLNGVLVIDLRDLAIVPAGEPEEISQIHLAPVWGGKGDVLPVTQTLSIDHTYVSIRN